jgi:hypothetical protein
VQQRFRKHRLPLVPALSAIYDPIGPMRPSIWRPFSTALPHLRCHCRRDRKKRKTSNARRENQQLTSIHLSTYAMTKKYL